MKEAGRSRSEVIVSPVHISLFHSQGLSGVLSSKPLLPCSSFLSHCPLKSNQSQREDSGHAETNTLAQKVKERERGEKVAEWKERPAANGAVLESGVVSR